MDETRRTGEVGPSGFRNLEPVNRAQRQAIGDKDFLEKSRLQDRRRNILQPPENFLGSPIVPAREAPSFCDEHDRFNQDVAMENYRRKQASLQKKEELYAQKRVVNHNREHGIKADDQAMEQREATRFETARTTAMGARRNQSGEAFNIITANYTRNDHGQTLASKDAAYQERRQNRATILYDKSHSVSHNIITGEPIKMPVPVKPQR